jgi:class 3 adenylate cyclase
MRELPTGVVTFLLTDVDGSTRLWEAHPEVMRQALARHDELVETLVARHDGVLVRPRGEGDSRFAVFPRASDGVSAGQRSRRLPRRQHLARITETPSDAADLLMNRRELFSLYENNPRLGNWLGCARCIQSFVLRRPDEQIASAAPASNCPTHRLA